MSGNCMPSLLAIIGQVMERNPYAQKYKKIVESLLSNPF
jgi:hypothetical protein